MTPFYGQGLNCGLEDVRILDILLSQEQVSAYGPSTRTQVDKRLASALSRYSQSRHEDLVAICDLAMRN
jgi:kynurenine 3-monooxygenase